MTPRTSSCTLSLYWKNDCSVFSRAMTIGRHVDREARPLQQRLRVAEGHGAGVLRVEREGAGAGSMRVEVRAVQVRLHHWPPSTLVFVRPRSLVYIGGQAADDGKDRRTRTDGGEAAAVLEPPLVMVPSGVLNSATGVLVRLQVLFHLSTGSKVGLRLVDGRVRDGRVVDGLAAGDRRGPGEHADDAGIFQGDADGFVEGELPIGSFGRFACETVRGGTLVGIGTGRKLGRIAVVRWCAARAG